jgi:hypothetical protein
VFERGTPSNTLSIFPTRQFVFVIDPDCIETLGEAYEGVVGLIADLRLTDCPVRIDLIIPIRDPVVSIDYDLSRATVVLDAFLIKLFGQGASNGT